MNPNKKVFITVLSFVLAMVVIACSCSSLIPSGTGGTEPMPGLTGKWQEPDTKDIFQIAWQNNQYVVTSVTWDTTSYTISSQTWDGSTLKWSYDDTDLNLTVSLETVSLSGDNLDITYSLSDGSTGSATLTRVK